MAGERRRLAGRRLVGALQRGAERRLKRRNGLVDWLREIASGFGERAAQSDNGVHFVNLWILASGSSASPPLN